MDADFVFVSTTPVLLVGPVDADYTVLVQVPSGPVSFGASASITSAIGGGAYQVGDTAEHVLKLKPGDSLYAVAPSASHEVTFFAQPC